MRRLEEKLKARIREKGAIPFRDFMAAALYDPEHGYYMRSVQIGARGDYLTSAHLHPIFGELLAAKFRALGRDLREAARHVGSPVTILEWGAGTGRLAADVLSALLRDQEPEFSFRYWIREISPHLREQQRRTLSGYPQVSWVQEEDLAASPIVGIVFSNELLDSFPVHRVLKEKGQWRELYVTLRGEKLAWTLGPLTQPEIALYFEQIGISLKPGQIADIAWDVVGWFERLASFVQQGYVVTIDYGETASRLYGQGPPEGTLRCFFRRQMVDDPLVRVGEQDITADVDFTLCMRAGERFGFEVVEFTTQWEFLCRLGLIERASALLREPVGGAEDLASRLALKHLVLPGPWGERFKVLIQKKRTADGRPLAVT